MENENDTLDRTAHAFGITDVEFSEMEETAQQAIRTFDQDSHSLEIVKNFPVIGKLFS